MGMTIDSIVKDLEQSIKQNELFIKAHQANMEIGEIKEYQYYIERDKLTIDTIRKYQMMQAGYENRLKADLKAILVDLQLEIEEHTMTSGVANQGTWNECIACCSRVIQQKINELKQESTTKTDKVDCKHTDCNNCVNHKYCDYEPTTKNDLGVDCVARQDVERFIEGFINEYTPEEELEFINLELDGLKHLPTATPQELKPMVEIDLYSVIKQKYIEREVLDKIRAEIETKYGRCKLVEYLVQYDGICTRRNEMGDIADILQIIDKYKAESEPQESEDEK